MAVVSDSILSLKPYEPGKPISELERELGITNIVKLASNENPLGPSPKAVQAIQQAAVDVHLYPDAATHDLRHAISNFHDIPANEIAVGNGSNEIINLVARTFLAPTTERAIIFDYSFIAYRLILKAFDVDFDVIPVGSDWRQDLSAMATAINNDRAIKVAFIANPNNPTGTHVTRDQLATFLETVRDDVIICLDEAYVEYATDPDYASAFTLRDAHPQLIVSRTFSKCYALAGLRVGYAVGPSQLINYMNRVREPFNCNALAQVAAIASLRDEDFVKRSAEINRAGRAQLLSALLELGLEPVPSQTNFFLCKVDPSFGSGPELYGRLLHKGVIVRPVAGYGIPDHVRISIGTETENRRLLDALAEIRDSK